MIQLVFILIVIAVFIVILWANNTLNEEYRYKRTLDKEHNTRRESEGKKKSSLIGGKP
ncbi:MAG: hypothetical protein HZA28_04555 [Candidatus Omnitrophica bacterium]|nr:hypothetical protein [Candidatus Omnitrophota bacterium]